MQHLKAKWNRLVWLWLFAGVFAAATVTADLVELKTTKDAETFGWSALPGARLQVVKEGKVGRYA